MGGESSGSFIPKQNPVKRSRKRVSRQVYLFTIISYVSLFAAVIASVGVFFYSSYTDRLLDDEIAALDSEINSFEDHLPVVREHHIDWKHFDLGHGVSSHQDLFELVASDENQH